MPQGTHRRPILASAEVEALEFFTHHEALTIGAAAACIFPDDELGPGAVEAGVVTYLDRALAGAEHHLQSFYRAGIRRLDAVAETGFGADFAACAPVQRDELIGAMAADALAEFGSAPTALAFFETLRSHTIEGVFSDPSHGGNRDLAGWRLLGYPGPQPGYSHAEQQLDAVIARDRIFTAADYPRPPEPAP